MSLLLVTIDCLRLDDLADINLPDAQYFPCIVAAPITPVACGSLLTGCYPMKHGIRNLTGYSLSPEVPTLAALFKEAGWRTHAVVPCAPLERRYGLDRGFDVYDDPVKGRGVKNRLWLDDVFQRFPDLGDDKLFLWAHFFDLHPPFEVADRSLKAVFDTRHAALQAIMRQLRAIARPELKIVVTGDHAAGFHQRPAKLETPMWLGHGEVLTEEMLTVPLVFSGFASFWKNWAVRQVDILPTICEEFGLPIPERIDGTPIGSQTEELRAYSESYLQPARYLFNQERIQQGIAYLAVGDNVFFCSPLERFEEMRKWLQAISKPPGMPKWEPSGDLLKRLGALGYL